MKRISLSKSVRTIGVMAILSATIAASLQQPIQAQSKGNKVPTTTDGTCAPLPKGVFYQEFGGITFSPAQKAAYRGIEAQIRKRYKTIGADFSTEYKRGVSEEKKAEIVDGSIALERDNLSSAEQVKILNRKYGQYARFSVNRSIIFTQKKIVEGQQIGLDFEAQTMAILTPEQKKVYTANLAIQRRIQACVDPTPWARIISPLPY
jgi:hypothetical protein